jgi:hypothetical protein
LGFVAAFCLFGCASNVAPFDSMITEKAPLYRSGPGQFTADTYLEKGTRVRVLERGDSYSRVETVTGDQGFVPSDALGSIQEETSPGRLGTSLR